MTQWRFLAINHKFLSTYIIKGRGGRGQSCLLLPDSLHVGSGPQPAACFVCGGLGSRGILARPGQPTADQRRPAWPKAQYSRGCRSRHQIWRRRSAFLCPALQRARDRQQLSDSSVENWRCCDSSSFLFSTAVLRLYLASCLSSAPSEEQTSPESDPTRQLPLPCCLASSPSHATSSASLHGRRLRRIRATATAQSQEKQAAPQSQPPAGRRRRRREHHAAPPRHVSMILTAPLL